MRVEPSLKLSKARFSEVTAKFDDDEDALRLVIIVALALLDAGYRDEAAEWVHAAMTCGSPGELPTLARAWIVLE